MIVQAGSTDVTTYFTIRTAADGTATTGATITDIDLQYVRSGDTPSAKVDATELAATNSAHADNKAKEVDATDAPGLYRVDWPDAAFAAGVREVILSVKLASSFTEHLRVELSPAIGTFSSGMVWVDDAGTNSTAWPYGTATHPTSTIANGKTIADANGLNSIRVKGNHTLAAAMEGYNFFGGLLIDTTEVVTLGGFSTEHSSFERLVISGVSGNAALINDATTFIDCYLWAVTNINGWAYNGRMEGACSIRDGGYATLHNVLFGSGLACTLTLQAPAVCDIENMAGELTLAGMDGGVCSVSMSRGAILTIDNTCTAGTITVTGAGTVTDNSGGGCTVTVQVAEADTVQISGDATAANNAELAFDGTGYAFTNCTMPTVTTLTGHTAQTGDTFALANGATGFAAIDTVVDAILVDTGVIGAAGAGLTAIPWNAAWDAEVQSEVQDVVGAAGASLTAIPWNAAWDAEVQSECADALTAYAGPTKAQMDTAHALLATPAQVNAEVVDCLNVDTYAEPAQGAPAATASLVAKLGLLYKNLRNKKTQTATTWSLYNDDAATVDHKATVADDGTTFTKGEIVSGP